MQGLSEAPFMRDVEHWGVMTIGTGLGNARSTNRVFSAALVWMRQRPFLLRNLAENGRVSRSKCSLPLCGAAHGVLCSTSCILYLTGSLFGLPLDLGLGVPGDFTSSLLHSPLCLVSCTCDPILIHDNTPSKPQAIFNVNGGA